MFFYTNGTVFQWNLKIGYPNISVYFVRVGYSKTAFYKQDILIHVNGKLKEHWLISKFKYISVLIKG